MGILLRQCIVEQLVTKQNSWWRLVELTKKLQADFGDDLVH